MKKHQGSIAAGIACLAFALISLVIGVFVFSTQKIFEQVGSDSGFSFNFSIAGLLPLVFIGIFIVVSVVFGIINIITGIRSNKVKAEGRISRCKVVSKHWSHSNSRRSNHYSLTVSYTGESGKEYQHVVDICMADYQRLINGMIIECKILGEDCYIDKYNIKVLENPNGDDEFNVDFNIF